MERREFLQSLAAGAVVLVRPGKDARPPSMALGQGRIRFPGDVVELRLPDGVDPARVRVTHRVDGRVAGTLPVEGPIPGTARVVRVTADPVGGLAPGRHAFVLEAGESGEDLGGFVVRPFSFGC